MSIKLAPVFLVIAVVTGCRAERGAATADAPTAGGGGVQTAAVGGMTDSMASAGTNMPAAAGGGASGGASGAGGSAVAGRTAAAGDRSDPPAAGAGGTAGAVATEVVVSEIAKAELNQPSDLEFNPYVPDELWVMNHGDSSATIIAHASTDARSLQRRLDPEGATHFMPSPTALAFGGRETTIVDAQGDKVEGTFATCPENTQSYMGPTLWTSDLRIFAIAKDQREAPFNDEHTGAEGPGSHIDMLHRTPTCTGIAWEGAGNIYWTYSGANAMFVRYDFAKDHGIGNDDHSDGSVWRYPVAGIGYVANTPSHIAYDRERKQLYMADTGNARVITFDPASATTSTHMSAGDNVDALQVAFDATGGHVSELIASSYGLKKPSGLEIQGKNLYVSDNETSTIHKFTLDGMPLGKLVIPGVKQGGLAGLAFGPDTKLYFVDMVGGRVLRLDTEL